MASDVEEVVDRIATLVDVGDAGVGLLQAADIVVAPEPASACVQRAVVGYRHHIASDDIAGPNRNGSGCAALIKRLAAKRIDLQPFACPGCVIGLEAERLARDIGGRIAGIGCAVLVLARAGRCDNAVEAVSETLQRAHHHAGAVVDGAWHLALGPAERGRGVIARVYFGPVAAAQI